MTTGDSEEQSEPHVVILADNATAQDLPNAPDIIVDVQDTGFASDRANSHVAIETGAVTFLDILGWKGIWRRDDDPISKLNRLIERIRRELDEGARGTDLDVDPQSEVISISDTIGLFTRASEQQASSALELHGRVCSNVIPVSIEEGIPVRGATSFGEYRLFDTRFVGQAIDEAAAWYEQADWIGVHMTPSADFCKSDAKRDALTAWTRYQPPRITWRTLCVHWDASLPLLRQVFRQSGPIGPEIVGKFTNTIAFIEKDKQTNETT